MLLRNSGKTRMVRIPEELAELVYANAFASGMTAPAYLAKRISSIIRKDAESNANLIRKLKKARKAQQP